MKDYNFIEVFIFNPVKSSKWDDLCKMWYNTNRQETSKPSKGDPLIDSDHELTSHQGIIEKDKEDVFNQTNLKDWDYPG